MASESGVVDELGRTFEGAELVDNSVIEEHLKAKNCDFAYTVYELKTRTLGELNSVAEESGSDDAASSDNKVENPKIEYGEGGTQTLAKQVRPENSVEITAYTEKELEAKKKAEARAKEAKAKKEKEQGERAD